MSCGASWHRTSCHVGQVSIGQDGIGPIDLGANSPDTEITVENVKTLERP